MFPTKDSILITGCSANSLGSAMALSFAAHGLHVFATARSLKKMAHLENNPNITLLELDVTSPPSITSAVSAVQTSIPGGGRLKYLINNAGAGYMLPILDTDIEKAKEMMEINFWGLLRVTKAFAPLIVKEKGTIVNVGSSGGAVPVLFSGIYGASKAAVNHLSETLRLELEPLNVKVITILAGIIRSNFFANVEFKMPETSEYKSMEETIKATLEWKNKISEPSTAEDFAEEVVRDVLEGKTGKTYTGAAGWTVKWILWWLPGWVVDNSMRKQGQMEKFRRRK